MGANYRAGKDGKDKNKYCKASAGHWAVNVAPVCKASGHCNAIRKSQDPGKTHNND